MHCPHCNAKKSVVLETRTIDGVLLRRRACRGCGKTYVTKEVSDASLQIPRRRTREEREERKASRGISSDGAHLQNLFR